MDDLAAQNDDLQKKLVVLAQRIDQYRAEEDTLRTTMINAQRLGENVIREAKQKAAEIIRTANIKAEDREQRSRDDVELAKQEIVTLKSEADSFKRSLIEMYRKHINCRITPLNLRIRRYARCSLPPNRPRPLYRPPRPSSPPWSRPTRRPPPSLRRNRYSPRCRRPPAMRNLPPHPRLLPPPGKRWTP